MRLKASLAARGTKLLIVIVPDKETIYHDLIPALKDVRTTATLDQFYDALDKEGVPFVRVHEALLEHKAPAARPTALLPR